MSNNAWSNDAIDTLTVPSGATSGERVIIANQTNGDAIDIYDTAGKLIFWIDKNGRLVAESSVSDSQVVIVGGSIFFELTNSSTAQLPPQMFGTITPTSTELFLNGGLPLGFTGANGAYIAIQTSTQSESGNWLSGNQRTNAGPLLQLDQNTNANQLVHVGSYKGNVLDAFGDVQISHLANFTPQFGYLTAWDWNSIGQGWQLEWFQNPFSSTLASFFVRNQSGGIPAIGTTIGVHAVFYG